MKKLFKTTRFKILVGVIAFILVGAFLAAENGHGESAQSTVIGTVFAPCHYVAQKIADGIDNVSGNVSGNAAYEKEIFYQGIRRGYCCYGFRSFYIQSYESDKAYDRCSNY